MKNVSIITNVHEINFAEWSDFVIRHSRGNIFQMPQMYSVYKQTPNYEPHIIAAYNESHEITGIMLFIILAEKGLLKKIFSKRAIVHGGPIVIESDKFVYNAILVEFNKIVSQKVIYAQIRNLYFQLDNCEQFRLNGFIYESHLNFLIKLDTPDNIYNRIGKGRLKQIKKAEKNKLCVRVYRDEIPDALINKGYSIIQEVYKNAKLPLTDVDIIKASRNEGILIVFAVYDENTLIGCRFALAYKDYLYGWYAGSRRTYYNKYPNDILIWETLKWACENGFKIFDYGGAGSPNKPYGVRDFKSQMGGQLVDFGRYEQIYNKTMFRIGKLGYRILQLMT